MLPPPTSGIKRGLTDPSDLFHDSRRPTTSRNSIGRQWPSQATAQRPTREPFPRARAREVENEDEPGPPTTQRLDISVAERTNQAALPTFKGSIPLRGPPAPTHLAWECDNSSIGVAPPTHQPATVNAGVHHEDALFPNGLRSDGNEAARESFVPGGVVWASHQATALDPRADPMLNKDFVQTNVSITSSKRRPFFVEFAHDRVGLQGYPMFTRTGKGLNGVPDDQHKYHIPVLDFHDRETNPRHRNYKPIYVKMYGLKPVRANSYIDISMSYPLSFKETIDHAGQSSAEDAEYVFKMADDLRNRAKRETTRLANRQYSS